MKKLTLVALLISAMSISVCAATKQPVAFAKTPKAVQKALLKNYTEEQVQLITSEKKVGRTDFMFILSDESKLVYDDKAELRVAHNQAGIKYELLPKMILEYVQKTLPHAKITEYKLEANKKEININDQMKLVFNKKDRFLRLDD